MVKHPLIIIAIAACVAAAAGVWFFAGPQASDQTPATASSDTRAKDFFGTPKKYDMKNGQEMRPRW